MARVLRAGQTSTQALQAVSDEFSPPLSTEFQYCFEQQNLGLSAELSLRDLAKRTGLLEMKIFVLGMLVQQQTGGNIAELVEKLATVIRGRQRIQGKIAALTAEGRIQAAILLLLPPVMFCILLIASPGYPLILFKYPSVIVGIAISELIGAVWIRQIVDFNF
ncbi:MAG: hypothetical protein EBV06_01680 [Planctomycetia bacterium]|jgi:tight adherence protein B|nr:hypothetical protein [Planctomycetia bacterium]